MGGVGIKPKRKRSHGRGPQCGGCGGGGEGERGYREDQRNGKKYNRNELLRKTLFQHSSHIPYHLLYSETNLQENSAWFEPIIILISAQEENCPK